MINIKKGTAHTLQQSDVVGIADDANPVVAGMLVRKDDATGKILPGLSAATGAGDLVGFAVTSNTDGDVIESGKNGMIMLDGNSVVETDQFVGAIGSYAIGEALTGSVAGGSEGLVEAADGTDRVIGYVEGTRQLPSTLTTVDGNGRAITVQVLTDVLAIKLAV